MVGRGRTDMAAGAGNAKTREILLNDGFGLRWEWPAVYWGSNSTIHSIPYLSLNIPAYEPQGLSPMGPSTFPPADSPLNILSASSRLSALTDILDLFSSSFTRPINSGTSLSFITLFLPILKPMYILFLPSF